MCYLKVIPIRCTIVCSVLPHIVIACMVIHTTMQKNSVKGTENLLTCSFCSGLRIPVLVTLKTYLQKCSFLCRCSKFKNTYSYVFYLRHNLILLIFYMGYTCIQSLFPQCSSYNPITMIPKFIKVSLTLYQC